MERIDRTNYYWLLLLFFHLILYSEGTMDYHFKIKRKSFVIDVHLIFLFKDQFIDLPNEGKRTFYRHHQMY